MLNGKIIKTCFIVLFLAVCLHLSLPVIADNGCEDAIITSTDPGNRIIPPNWRDQYKPIIYASNDEIIPGGSITLYVFSGGRACPDYTWTVSGPGYTFDKDGKTEKDLEIITLTSAAGT